ncbi:heme ABC exporter ATP-binding protein CcmA [Legionella sp. W05-934-2]|jgi:heme exporter protein A|uniref:heme ABC exporter ATP-binding protein CcmA n=1 Tax=Legionella sp. W05-934-2 TaxID=1198649 RepID=UPI003461B1EE
MIEVKQLYYSIQATPILTNINCSIPAACVFHIQAGNGAGKTTLLQLLCGLKQPESGLILFNQQPIQDRLSRFQQNINYIGHQIPLQNQLSISEHWLLSSVPDESYHQALNYFQLGHCEHVPAIQLSAGQRKKAVLMALLLHKRPIWILDEPFVGLDQQSISNLLKLIEHHINQNGIVVVTSHQPLPNLSCKTMNYML